MPTWTSGEQQHPYPTGRHYTNLVGAGLGVGALSLLGPLPIRPGYTAWDAMLKGIRAVEEYSPARMLRTFQLSQMLSPLETASQQFRSISPHQISKMVGTIGPQSNWLNWISAQVGRDVVPEVMEKGLRFEGGQLFAGQDLLLKHARVVRNISGALPHFQEATARSLLGEKGSKGLHSIFRQAIEFQDATGKTQQEIFHFFGGASKGQSAWRSAAGYGTSLVERFNRLLREVENNKVLGKIPGFKHIKFSVKPGSGLETLGRLSLKYGLLAPAAYLGYQQVDWWTRNQPLLDPTIFRKGLTAAAATLGVRAHVASSRVAEVLGGHAWRETQEKIAPGSTSLGALAAFPIIGGLTAAGIGYGKRIGAQIGLQKGGFSVGEASGIMEAASALFRRRLYPKTSTLEVLEGLSERATQKAESIASGWSESWVGGVASKIASTQRRGGFVPWLSRALGEVTPGRIWGFVGAAAGLALVAPFVPGALVPEKRPDELRRIYRGEQLVPIRKGRWWEMGRCLIKSNTYTLIDGTQKTSDQIVIGDVLVGSNHEPAEVLKIHIRTHQGDIYKFSSAFNRDVVTGLTAEHRVPILRKRPRRSAELLEVSSDQIRINDYVEIPVKLYPSNRSEMLVLDIIKEPICVDNQRAYSQQKNWFTGQIQKSGRYSLPLRIPLNEDIGFLFGIYLADGNIGFHKKSPTMIEIAHATHEQAIIQRLVQIVETYFTSRLTIRFKDTGKKVKLGCFISRVCSGILAKLFRWLFYPDQYNAELKDIPNIFLDASPEFKKGLIDGYAAGDGHFDRNTQVISSARKWLLEKIQLIALSVGILSGIGPKEENDNKGKWRLRFHATGHNTNPPIIYHENKVYAAIRTITIEEYNDLVYDFQVDHPDHLFQAGTFLVHNSIFQGDRIEYWDQSWYQRLLKRGREKAIWGKCLTPLSLIPTINGLKTANMINTGDCLVSEDGKFHQVHRVSYREINENVYSFTTSCSIGFELSITGNHPLYLLTEHTKDFVRYFNREWIPAEQVYHLWNIASESKRRRYRLFVPYYIPESIVDKVYIEDICDLKRIDGKWFLPLVITDNQVLLKNEILSWSQLPARTLEKAKKLEDLCNQYLLSADAIRSRLKFYKKQDDGQSTSGYVRQDISIKNQIALTYDFGRLIGYYLAEGHTDERGVYFSFHKDEHEYHNDVCRLMYLSFGLIGHFTIPEDSNGIKIEFYSKAVSHIMQGLVSGKTRNGYDKKLNPLLINSNEEFLYGVIEGLVNGDGSIEENRKINITLAETPFVHQLRLVCSRLRLFASFSYLRPRSCSLPKGSSYSNDHLSRKIRLRFDSLSTYELNKKIKLKTLPVNTISRPRKTSVERLSDGFAVLISKIGISIFKGRVFDFEIRDVHSFLTVAGIVHNSEDELSPISKWFRANTTYELERRHYYDRPSPLSGTFGADIPIIGPLVAATVGKLIKPPLTMHSSEWQQEGFWGTEYKTPPLKFGETPPVKELGEVGPGAPVSPYDFKSVLGEQISRASEMVGLPGFVAESLKKRMTGTGGFFEQDTQLATAGDIYSTRRAYWDQNLGGALGMSEFVRRLYPSKRGIPQYNPIENNLASWLPGPGERSLDFRHGDPASNIPRGDTRLPGEGLAAMYPELQGVDPESYTPTWKLHVLADVASYSESYGRVLGQVQSQAQAGHLNPEEYKHYQEILARVEDQKQRKEFAPYKYFSQGATTAQKTLAAINEDSKEDKGPSFFERFVGSYWEKISHGAETPMEYLTPISPAMKLVHRRDAIEDYERTQLYGTKSSYWDRPVENFLRPFAQSVAHAAGWEGIPEPIEKQRELNEYFDVLKYIKATRLEKAARAAGNKELAQDFGRERRETLFGINPFSMDFSQVFRSLPRQERDYFSEFMKAAPVEREKILGMIPENERSLYVAHWQARDVQDWQKVILSGEASEKQIAQAESAMQNLQSSRAQGGFPQDEELWAEYLKTREEGESYPDWYRRTYLLAKALKGRALPGPDWVGFSPMVQLDDVKAKVVERLGENMYDYDIWPDQTRALVRKPWLDQAVTELGGRASAEEARQQVLQILAAHRIDVQKIAVLAAHGDQNEVDVQFSEDRSSDARKGLKEMMRG